MHTCFYCGDDSQKLHRDHVRPVSIQAVSRSYDSKDTVPCCVECNSALSNNYIMTVEERAQYLLSFYVKKYKKVLSVPDRSASELEEYGERMRSTIVACMNQKKVARDKMAVLSKTAVGIYDESVVKNLNGPVTIQKAIVYRLVEAFFADLNVSIKSFCETWSSRVGVSEKEIDRILEEKDYADVSIAYKYEHHYPLDLTIKKWRSILKKTSK